MKAFVWKRIEKVSNNYHEDGGLLIIAENLRRAREIAITRDGTPMIGVADEPDFIFEATAYQEEVIAFPDTGCC